MVTFEQARQSVEQAWPDYVVAPYGYEGDDDWFVLLLPTALGARIAAVSKATGTLRWINENADEYFEDQPVGDWSNEGAV
jgi:hypothetical protein